MSFAHFRYCRCRCLPVCDVVGMCAKYFADCMRHSHSRLTINGRDSKGLRLRGHIRDRQHVGWLLRKKERKNRARRGGSSHALPLRRGVAPRLCGDECIHWVKLRIKSPFSLSPHETTLPPPITFLPMGNCTSSAILAELFRDNDDDRMDGANNLGKWSPRFGYGEIRRLDPCPIFPVWGNSEGDNFLAHPGAAVVVGHT